MLGPIEPATGPRDSPIASRSRARKSVESAARAARPPAPACGPALTCTHRMDKLMRAIDSAPSTITDSVSPGSSAGQNTCPVQVGPPGPRGPPAGACHKILPDRKFDWLPVLGPLRLGANPKQNLKSRQTNVPSPNWPHVRRGPPAGACHKILPDRKFDWLPVLGPLRLGANPKQNLKSRQTNVPSPNWPHVRRGPPAGTPTRNAPDRKFSLVPR